MLDFNSIGRNVRNVRLNKGMTQENLAEKLEVTPDYVSKIENGVKHPSLKTLDLMADLLGVSVAILLDGTNPASPNYGFNEFYDLIQDWEPETRILLLETAKSFSPIDEKLKNIKK